MMDKNEIIERLRRIAKHAVHVIGEEPFIMSLDDGTAVYEAIDIIQQSRSQSHWIPCSEQLPEEYGNYLATMDDGDVQECTYSPEKNTPFMRGGWSTCEADGIVFLDIAEVTAWQPLPEPYREGES